MIETLSGSELIIVALALFFLACMAVASIAGFLRRFTHGHVEAPKRRWWTRHKASK